jgi:protein farnesyltransferase subunit beta
MEDNYGTCIKSFDDEGVKSVTSDAQMASEAVLKFCASMHGLHLDESSLRAYVQSFFQRSLGFWMKNETFAAWNPCYVLLPLRALGSDCADLLGPMTSFLRHRICENGLSGFPQDNLHFITHWAGVTGIALIGTPEAYELLDRQAFYRILRTLKMPDGSFRASYSMECDVRTTFAALAVASILNMLTPELTANSFEFIMSCRNYDGGFSPRPELESHGGYVFCAIGVLKILGRLGEVDLARVIRWLVHRQMEFSGGFNGRPNKLVDSCYSWWIGAPCRIIAEFLGIPPFWNRSAMISYLLQMAQTDYGFCSRPNEKSDLFHTCLSMAGLCLFCEGKLGDLKLPEMDHIIPCTKALADQMREYFRQREFFPE